MENGQEDFWKLKKLIQTFEKLDYELRQKFPEILEALINIFRKNEGTNDREIFQEGFEKYNQALYAKREIKDFLANKVQLKASHDLARQLKNIRDNKGYCVDEFYAIHAILDKNASQEIEEDLDWQDKLFSEGTIDYIDENYFRRRREIGAIITVKSFPANFLFHLKKLIECYSLGLFEATIIYCRAVIESGTFENLKKRPGEIDKNVKNMAEYSLKESMRKIRKYIKDANIYENAKKIIKLANDELHEKKDIVRYNEENAYNSIKITFSYIEHIFS